VHADGGDQVALHTHAQQSRSPLTCNLLGSLPAKLWLDLVAACHPAYGAAPSALGASSVTPPCTAP
jgi:hypothetical protein